ncbi:CBS domain-containing protein [Aeoliella mucimassa]|uniref:Hypoxic response protein 1 n=1 Tax=Aeoliella mucimassa TaxID=2527972 RepID=A0A518AQX1_9BACT|nr:CBS domain-containing protein [Aeoliella mucimassa]QDU57114.1 Hypoxic response protein 1 [Aeoliella mucimassa]
MLTAEQIMTPNVYTIHPDATIQQAISMLLDKRISGLPVIDDSGTLVGVLTEYGLLAMVYDKQIMNNTVAQHMTREVISVEANEPVNHVADQFILHRVRRLPVIRQGKLIGLISRVDVLRALCEAQAPVCSA